MKRQDNGQRATSVSIRQVNKKGPRITVNLQRSTLQHLLRWGTEKIGDALYHLLLIAFGIGAKVTTVAGDLHDVKPNLLSQQFIGLWIDGHIAFKHDGEHLRARQCFQLVRIIRAITTNIMLCS